MKVRSIFVLAAGAALDQGQGAANPVAEVRAPPLGARRTGKVEKCLNARLHAPDFVLDDGQIVRRQAGVAFQTGLHEHFDRSQRIAQLVGDAGGNLAERGELFRMMHFPFALLQLANDALDLFDDGVHLLMQTR